MLIPIGGFLLGLVDGAPLGTAMIALAPLALLQDVRGSQLREGGLVLAVIFIVVMTVVYHLVYLLMFTISGEAASWLQAMTRVDHPDGADQCRRPAAGLLGRSLLFSQRAAKAGHTYDASLATVEAR